MVVHPDGTRPGGNVATSAWSSPPVRTSSSGSTRVAAPTVCSGSPISSAVVSTSMVTPDARATCPRSASRPSETSTIAVAPARAATAPCPYGTLRHPLHLDDRPRRAEPAGEHEQPGGRPAQPAGEGQHVAGRAPSRRTGARPSRVPRAVTERVTRWPRVVSPPSRLTPAVTHSARRPAARSRVQRTSVSPGAEKPTTTPCGRAPMASTSATFTATALRPMSFGPLQSRRKWTPSTRTSVDTTTEPPTARTAPSSPGPTRTSSAAGRSRTISAMRANSPSWASVVGPVPPGLMDDGRASVARRNL